MCRPSWGAHTALPEMARVLAQIAVLLGALLMLAGCGDDGETEPGPGEGGGSGGGTVECIEEDPFDPAECPETYPDHACVAYVDGDVEASGAGWSWGTAVKTVQEGIDLARCGALNSAVCELWQVWVKQGSYYIHQGCREHVLLLRPNVGVYGGFAGNEDTLPDRDWQNHETILDGRDGPGEDRPRVYHVVLGADDAVLDGFTIQYGNADHDVVEVHQSGAGLFNFNASPTVENCTFQHNFATASGAGMNNYDEASPIVTNCTFEDNEAGSSGAGMQNSLDSCPVVRDCVFRGNRTQDTGSGMNNWESSPTVTNCTFVDNETDGGGAALSNANSSPSITGCTFENNFAASNGGAMHSWETTLTVDDCVFRNNVSHKGGAMSVWDTDALITNSTFDANSAAFQSGDEGNCNGGAIIFGSSSTGTFEGNTFTGNTAEADGGALSVGHASASFKDGSFAQNTAAGGGGALMVWDAAVTVDGSSFVENSATGAGAIAVGVGSAEIANCAIESNTATERGGGLYVNNGATAVIVSSVFRANTASSGAGIHALSGGALSLLNCTLAYNEATGGAGSGGAIGNADELTVINSILWGNSPDEIADSGATAISVTYTDIEDAAFADPTNVHVDPSFVNQAGGDLHLQPGSPCVDVADDSVAPATDLEGNPRAGLPDMGAYEYQPGG